MRIRVLIADDEPPLLRMVVDLIRAHDGFEVTATAVDADEAAERAAETMPDVALLDVRMPRRGGAVYRSLESDWGELFFDGSTPAFFAPAF